MANKEKSLLSYAVVANALQILLCFLIYILRKFNLADLGVVQGVFFVIELLIWLFCGLAFSLGLDVKKIKYGLSYSVIALLPIIIITAVCVVMGYFSNAETANWSKYFFVGASVNFWHKPALILSVFIKNSAFILFGINIIVLFAASLIGTNYGMILNKSKLRKNKGKTKIKKIPSEKTKNTESNNRIQEVDINTEKVVRQETDENPSTNNVQSINTLASVLTSETEPIKTNEE